MVKIKKLIYWLIGLLGIVLFLVGLIFYDYYSRGIFSPDKNLKVIICDVGQGDAILIRTSAGQDILIDGGPDDSVLTCLGKYLPFSDREIEMMILTHPHADHLVGLVSVLKNYSVDEVLIAGVQSSDSIYQDFLNLVKEKEIKTVIVLSGKIFSFSDGSRLEILYPISDLTDKTVKDLNDSSIVSKLTYGQSSFLFTGDLGGESEADLLKTNQNLQAEVLKVGHHGSSYSLSELFIQAVKPRLAVISVSLNNSFHHPSSRIVRRLARFGVEVLRTDLAGDIELVSDGEKIKVKYAGEKIE
jgi:competence protein ComEC